MDQATRQRKSAHKQRKAKGKAVAAAQDKVFRESLKRWRSERPLSPLAIAPAAALALVMGRG